MRVATLVADTTISCPRELAAESFTSTAAAEVTFTSFVSKPIEEKTKVTGKEATVKLNSPLSLVYTPTDVPLTVTDTAGIDSPKVVLFTFPLIVTDCAFKVKQKKQDSSSNNNALVFFGIVKSFLV